MHVSEPPSPRQWAVVHSAKDKKQLENKLEKGLTRHTCTRKGKTQTQRAYQTVLTIAVTEINLRSNFSCFL